MVFESLVSIYFMQGVHRRPMMRLCTNEDSLSVCLSDIHELITHGRTCICFDVNFAVNGTWLTQRTTLPFHLTCSDLLHCCRNLELLSSLICMVLLHQNLPQSKDVESLLRTEVHAGSTKFSWQFLRDCFVHVRCIPQQNSQ